MKYNIGDKVRIKSIDWYNEHKDETDDIECSNNIYFYREMSKFCGKVMTISHVRADHYTMVEDLVGYWSDEMIECKVEDEPKFKVGDIIAKAHLRLRVVKIKGNKYIVEERPDINLEVFFTDQDAYRLVKETKPNIIEEAKAYWDSIKDAWICPEDYIFKDENGNVINAQKIVLEKKKREYPKTYAECSDILSVYTDPDIDGYKGELLWTFQKLLICRDAYWKLYGDEMGLGKPWEPDWKNKDEKKWVISRYRGELDFGFNIEPFRIFAFPTEEMRDAFKENFDPDIEICKEFL